MIVYVNETICCNDFTVQVHKKMQTTLFSHETVLRVFTLAKREQNL